MSEKAVASHADARRRVLVSAIAVSPYRGSEAAGGWNICSRLGRYHDVTVLLTPELAGHDYREEIGRWEREHGPTPGVTWEYVARPCLSRVFQREGGRLTRGFYYIGYAAWQRAALEHARRLHAERSFEVVHQLNYTGFREPSYLYELGAPFVWGPVGGGSNMPRAFFPLFTPKERLFYWLRNRANLRQMRKLKRPRLAAKAARHIFATSDDNLRMIRQQWGRDAELMIDSAASEMEARVRSFDGRRPLRLVWSGLHHGRKALPILLRALARLASSVDVRVAILGDGPLTEPWRAEARVLGVDEKLEWKGRLPHAQALAEMGAADVFVFTSLQEEASFVTLEALALGLPVVCHDACGMAIAVNDSCGIKVPMQDADTSIRGFSEALRRLYAQGSEVERLSRGAIARADELRWEHKVRRIAEVYTQVAAEADGTRATEKESV